jgi:hypothetical protein
MKESSLFETISKLSHDYALSRIEDQEKWESMSFYSRVEKLNSAGLHGIAAEKAASFNRLFLVPEPFYTKLIGAL